VVSNQRLGREAQLDMGCNTPFTSEVQAKLNASREPDKVVIVLASTFPLLKQTNA